MEGGGGEEEGRWMERGEGEGGGQGGGCREESSSVSHTHTHLHVPMVPPIRTGCPVNCNEMTQMAVKSEAQLTT